MTERRRIGFGAMRLSTDGVRPVEEATAVVHAALEGGATVIDTADAYAIDEHDVGANERIVARALATWSGGDRSRVLVVTKGGLERPGGRWVNNGRAKHLRAACEASLRALGVEQIAMYLLHAPDPDVSIETSVRALSKLRDEGLVRAIGLSNVNVDQLERARGIAELAAVEVAASVFGGDAFAGGVIEVCIERGIDVLAHSPLGGPKKKSAIAKQKVLARIGAKHGVSAACVALAWLVDLSPRIVPIPGATRVETARELGSVVRVVFDEEDRRALDEAFPFGRFVREPRASRRPARAEREVVVLMGIQGAGKSSRVRAFVEQGYVRLNRDVEGGKLAKLNRMLEEKLDAGATKVVLDNTYGTRAMRAEVIETAWKKGAHVRAVWLDTGIEDAQINAVQRMLDRYGALLGPEEIKQASKKDPNVFGPDVQYRYLRSFEPPREDEGFESIERVPFVRIRSFAGPVAESPNPQQTSGITIPEISPGPTPRRPGPVYFIELDGVLRRSRAGLRAPLVPSDVDVITSRAPAVRALAAEQGSALVALAWIPEISSGVTSRDDAIACFHATCAALGVTMRFAFCPHPAGPQTCWCRRPLPGLGVSELRALSADPARCTMIGRAPTDRVFAARLGFAFVESDTFFK